jgi:hypothetical protein
MVRRRRPAASQAKSLSFEIRCMKQDPVAIRAKELGLSNLSNLGMIQFEGQQQFISLLSAGAEPAAGSIEQ